MLLGSFKSEYRTNCLQTGAIQFRQVRPVAQDCYFTAIVLHPTLMAKRIKNRSLTLDCSPKGRLLVSLTQKAVSLQVYRRQLHWEPSSK